MGLAFYFPFGMVRDLGDLYGNREMILLSDVKVEQAHSIVRVFWELE